LKSAHLGRSIWNSLVTLAHERCDIASSVFFRIAFGSLMASWCWDYLQEGRVTRLYIEPMFHFTYYAFDGLRPWPGQGMIVHFLVLLILAVCIAVGLFYRVSCLLFALGFTYVFLLERTNYQNHYYLIALISWWLPWLPLHRAVSVDAWLWPRLRSDSLPRWCLGVLQFHVGLPYVMGGIAKFQPDWLLGRPMDQMLAAQQSLPWIGPSLASESAGVLFAWCGMLFDLFIVPALMYSRTRPLAYTFCVAFHLCNAVLFQIHVFPWFMIVASTIFFSPSWPRSALGGQRLATTVTEIGHAQPTRLAEFRVGLLMIYAVFHVLWPLRLYLEAGDASWHERGHYFAWRMMLRGKAVVLGYAVKDQVTGRVSDGQAPRFLNTDQLEKFGRDPEMVLHFAHFLGERYQAETGNPASVYVLALASLNGRKPELLIDPNVDLMQEPRGFHSRPWVLPQTEPLRDKPWDAPISEWRNAVTLPELKFLQTTDD
jgi:hypothetical protein